MTKESPKAKLEDFRYDSKLFKQAYKAGLRLKELEEKEKQTRKLKIISVVLLSIFVIFLGLIIYRSPLFRSEKYILTQSRGIEFKDINREVEVTKISNTEFEETFVDAKAALYANLNTGEILYQKNIDEQLHIASITKLMSVLIALREFELTDTVEVKEDWYALEDMSWSLGLDKGDKVTVETLLNAMLISSYNDAAFALADNMEGGWEVFIEEMNTYTKSLGLENTEFYNPAGLDNYGENKSTVRELYMLGTVVYKNDFIMETITKRYAKLSWDIGEEEIYTTNAIIGQYGNIGGKTGYTELANGCFLGITNDGMITIVLGSSERFDDSKKLLTEL
jgi:D-alanyl-D-alanine carboxypeptidase